MRRFAATAAELLAATLGDGPQPVREVMRTAVAGGVTLGPLRDALARLGVRRHRVGSEVTWSLPDTSPDATRPQEVSTMALRRSRPQPRPRAVVMTSDDYAETYVPMAEQMAEARRIATEHDPTQRSACRLCGRWTGPRGDWTHCAGWKLCGTCLPLLQGGLAAVWADITGREVNDTDSWALGERYGNPTYFVGRQADDSGNDRRWEHLPRGVADSARSMLRRFAAERNPRPSPSETGCAWCGVSRAVRWETSPWRWGGRSAPRAYLCPPCAARWQRAGAGVYNDWRVHFVAEACDMPRAIAGEHFDLRTYLETAPAERAGTDERFAYLGELPRRIRASLVRTYPRYANERERRVMRIERVIAQEERLAATVPLSSLRDPVGPVTPQAAG